MKIKSLLLGLALGLLPSIAFAACSGSSITVKDSTGTTQTFCIGGTSGALLNQTSIVDSTGANVMAVNSSGYLTISNTAFTANAGTNLNTSALATSANQTNASQKTQIVDGSGNVIAATSNNLNVQCANCGSGVSTGDEATFTAGTSLFAGAGGFYQTTATSNPLTNGQQGFFQLTTNRALFTNLRNASGTEIGTASTPVQVSLANTATNSTAVKVDGSGVTQPVSGTVTANQGTANSAANAWPTVPAPTATASFGITPVVSASLESSHVLKSGAGNLYSVYVTTGATAGYLMTFNATSAPSDGSVTPVECSQAPANSTTSVAINGSPPDAYSTGITVVFSSTGCFTKTASATAFFKGRVQ